MALKIDNDNKFNRFKSLTFSVELIFTLNMSGPFKTNLTKVVF